MVLASSFHCPTELFSRDSCNNTIASLVCGKTWAVVTTDGWVRRGLIKALIAEAGKPEAVLHSVPENPKISDITNLAPQLPAVDLVVAIGGGSVIDCAKGLLAYRAIGMDEERFLSHLQNGTPLDDEEFLPAPLACVPTTSGTGSEVTPWATIWGGSGEKYSLHHPMLYPRYGVLDPELCVSMPRKVTLSSGLDALSHAMESVWNVNNTPISDSMATLSIAMLMKHLPVVLDSPSDMEARRQVQFAATYAGLAMGTTNSALAHSISYPFTARFGMPHGIACSFTLGRIARYNLEADPLRLAPIAAGMGCPVNELPETIDRWLDGLGLGDLLAQYCRATDVEALGEDLITPARAANNIREVDEAAARALAHAGLKRFMTRRVALA